MARRILDEGLDKVVGGTGLTATTSTGMVTYFAKCKTANCRGNGGLYFTEPAALPKSGIDFICPYCRKEIGRDFVEEVPTNQ